MNAGSSHPARTDRAYHLGDIPASRPVAIREETNVQMSVPKLKERRCSETLVQVVGNAQQASDFLKAIAHESRLAILCTLAEGEKSVTEIEDLLSLRQPTVSQQLARLRSAGLVEPRRDGKTVYYRLANRKPQRILEVVYELFCAPEVRRPDGDSAP